MTDVTSPTSADEAQPDTRFGFRNHGKPSGWSESFSRPMEGGRIIAGIMALYSVFAAYFIYKPSFVVNGERYFTLFDDAMISMRYARNLADGSGLVWNPGEAPIEGYTNFLWVLWMSLMHLLPLPDRLIPLTISITGVVLVLAAIHLAARLANALAPESRIAPVVAALLVATCYPLSYWTLRGMEVGLVAVICLASLVVAVRCLHDPTVRNSATLALLLGAGFLTRPDMAVLSIAIVPLLLVLLPGSARLRALLTIGAIVGAVVVAITAFRLAYFGEIVPNTYMLKVEGVALENRLGRGARVFASIAGKGGLALVIGLGLVGLLAGLRRNGKALGLAATTGVAFLAYNVYVGGDAWEVFRFSNRYITTVLPVLLTLAAVGVAAVVESRYPARYRLVGVAGVLVVASAVLARLILPRIDAVDLIPDLVSVYLKAGLVLLMVGLAVAVVNRRSLRLPTALAAILLTVGLAASLNGRNFEHFRNDGIWATGNDEAWTRYALALQEHTEPGTVIALSAAGNLPYFGGDRQFVDVLGKMDAVVAATPPALPEYPPGHQKFNYAHSAGTLQPDLFAQAFEATAPNIEILNRAGYRNITKDVFVRTNTTKVDVAAVEAYITNNRLYY